MADPAQVDASQLPYPDRFVHKNWKVRKEGYEAAAKDFEATPSESHPVFKQFLQDPGLWKDAAGDSNVAAQQEGLTALSTFLKYGGLGAASKTRGLTIEPIREKGLSSTRPAIKAAATEVLLLYVEADKPDFVVDELLPALAHKQPKVIAATLASITTIFHNFGCKIVDPKPVLKQLPKVFGHADKNVRAEATNLTVELYRWLREAIKGVFWNDLKPLQQQELEKLFEKVREEPPPKQERLTQSQQAAQAIATESGGEDDVEDGDLQELVDDEPVVISAFDLAEPVDISSKVCKDLHTNLASSKWKDRKEALDGLLLVLDTPRIKDGHFDEIIRDLTKIISKDSMVAVVAVAANCVEKLALGLKRAFAKYRATMLSPMLERCKEKKQVVTDALAAAVDAVFASCSMSDCLEEILGFLSHKNPQVKLETVKFLTRCLKATRDVPSKAEVKSIADAATKLLTESTEAMRTGGAEILGTLMKIMGERAMGPYLDGLDDIRKAKIKEFFESAVVKAKDRPKPIVAPTKAIGTSAPGKRGTGPGGKKPPAATKSAPSTAAPSAEEEHAPSKPQPTARSLARPGSSRIGSGLGAPAGSKLNALKKPSSGGAASPQRRVISPPLNGDDRSAAPSPSKFGMGRGGLAGRSLSKPAPTRSVTDAKGPPSPLHAGMPTMDMAELEELRLEKQQHSASIDSLRSTNSKLFAEISELQNQNAQLIEDHTRDVLQIKAKETQLVRARGECEVLRTEVESAKKEIERQKREMSRLGRESFGREQKDGKLLGTATPATSAATSPQEENADENDNGHGEIFTDGSGSNNNNGKTTRGIGTARPGLTAFNQTSNSASATTAGAGRAAAGGGKLTTSSRNASYRDRFDLHNINTGNTIDESDEKENTDSNPIFSASSKISPPTSSTFGNGGSSSPQRSTDSGGDVVRGGATDEAITISSSNTAAAPPSLSSSSSTTATTRSTSAAPPEPAENWRRAAEVTSQLKARIEQMKARQGISSRPTTTTPAPH